MEDSMDMESMAPLRPQNFLFGCELKADKKEYHFKGDDDENEHQLSLRTVSLGAGAKDELNIVEAEGLNYEGKPIKVILASLKLSVQPTVSLGGFEITPPVTLRLKAGSGPLYVSGQHLVALEDEDLESEEEEETKVSGKRAAAELPAKMPQKKAKLSVKEEDDEDDDDEDFDDEEDDDDDDDDDEEDEERPVKKVSAKSPESSQNGKVSKPSTPAAAKPKTKTPEKSASEKKPQTPHTPKAPLRVEEIKAKLLANAEKGVVLPKVELRFQNYVKNCLQTEDPKVVQELFKWRQSLKDFK